MLLSTNNAVINILPAGGRGYTEYGVYFNRRLKLSVHPTDNSLHILSNILSSKKVRVAHLLEANFKLA